MGVGRVPAWDDTNGKAVISDVIQAWAEQLSTNVPARAGTIESYVRSKNMRKRFPLPEGAAFVFCQEAACIVGKREAKTPRERHGLPY